MRRSEVPSEVRAVRFRGTERFRLIRLLGQGGMGVVYEAEDGELGLRVALKLLPGLQPDLLRRFKKEFRAAANIRHPNVVRFGDLFSDGERWFFTMELVQGVDLFSHVRGLAGDSNVSTLVPPDPDSETVRAPKQAVLPKRPEQKGTLDQPRVRERFSQLAQGLAAIHAAGQIHRDIKPSNVLVTREGRVVILDFGLATEGEVRTTFFGAGTPAYMAPEQSSADPVTPAADWYSFGVMLYEALTGEPKDFSPVVEEAKRWAGMILECSPMAIRATKETVLTGLNTADFKTAFDHKVPGIGKLMASADHKEGPKAFAEKRKPVWKNR